METFAVNRDGRDLVVGDIHGIYTALDEALRRLAFDPERDRLFSVGDLIDRGPESPRALDYLTRPWFHAIQGNHERMLLEAQTDQGAMDNWLLLNGGDWWQQAGPETRRRFRETVAELPLALEIETRWGQVGIIHADVPLRESWQGFTARLTVDPEAVQHAVWSRRRVELAQRGQTVPPIAGIDLVVCGHTPLERALRVQNIYYLDTAAAYWQSFPDAKLSILQIQPDLELTAFPTRRLQATP